MTNTIDLQPILRVPMSAGKAAALVDSVFERRSAAYVAMGRVGPNLSPEDREEVFQDALEELLKAVKRSGRVVENWHSWFFGTCRNMASARVRRNQSESGSRVEFEDVGVDSFEDPTFDAVADLKLELMRHLGSLDLIYREPLEMKLAGASYDEIAETLGISADAARQRGSRGYRQLARLFNASGYRG